MITDELEQLRQAHGPWTAHNVALGQGASTLPGGPNGSDYRVRRAVQAISDFSRKPLNQCRTLDLGCLEGMFTLELASRGAQALGVEPREASLAKAEFARKALGLENAHFQQGDMRAISRASHGMFDVILCIGVLYHLDFPDCADVLAQLADMCSGMLYIDTRISVNPNTSVVWGRSGATASLEGCEDGKEMLQRSISSPSRGESPHEVTLHGEYYQEHASGLSLEEKARDLWASVDNERSFWFTRASLVNALQHAGFSTVMEVHTPALLKRMADRVSLVAIKGEPVVLNTGAHADIPLLPYPEGLDHA